MTHFSSALHSPCHRPYSWRLRSEGDPEGVPTRSPDPPPLPHCPSRQLTAPSALCGHCKVLLLKTQQRLTRCGPQRPSPGPARPAVPRPSFASLVLGPWASAPPFLSLDRPSGRRPFLRRAFLAEMTGSVHFKNVNIRVQNGVRGFFSDLVLSPCKNWTNR